MEFEPLYLFALKQCINFPVSPPITFPFPSGFFNKSSFGSVKFSVFFFFKKLDHGLIHYFGLLVLKWHRVLYQYGFLKILLLNKVIEIAILIFSHICWDFPLKLLLLVDYGKLFCWTSSSFTRWSPTEGLFICLDCLLLCVFLCFFLFLASLML